MTTRPLHLGLLLAVLALTAACSDNDDVIGGSAASRAYLADEPRPNLTDEIPPCTPAEGAEVDPCAPGASPSIANTNASDRIPFGEPVGVRHYLDGGSLSGHLVVRATYLPGTVRCVTQNSRRPPYAPLTGEAFFGEGLGVVTCYADIRVNAYVLGSGPATLSVVVEQARVNDREMTDPADQERERSTVERVVVEGGIHYRGLGLEVPAGGIGGREEIMFLGPAQDHSLAAWQVFSVWDVERREDGTVIAVHPYRGWWLYHHDETYQASVEMSLNTFKTKVAEAYAARVTEYGGRIKADPDSPMLITRVDGLAAYHTESGAAAHPSGLRETPPPCGTAVPNYLDNHGLVLDCDTLLGLKDTLRGTATLNWSVDIAIAKWEGIRTGGIGRVTAITLVEKGLTGTVPAELAALPDLTTLKLSGNSLTGCIPVALQDVPTNDLDDLGLPDCAQ